MAKYTPPTPIPDNAHAELEHYPPLVRTLLIRRGITSAQEAEVFLEPDYERDTHDPFLLPDMKNAVDRIIQTLDAHEHIAIYADFDADGVPGAVILHDVFNKLGHQNITVYIPHRHEEGYGVHRPALDHLHNQGVNLIITVDVGITYHDEVSYAQELGMDVIVTDHHEPQDPVPQALAVINPKLNDYPDNMICGAAVAWKLAQAVLMTLQDADDERVQNIPEGWEKWLLDMVGIATISDMVPLVKENRALATYGLHVLRKNRRIGLRSLYHKNYLRHHTLTEDDIAFTITPRLNAASRMAHPRDAFDLLIARESADADGKADYLTTLNDQRKKLVAQIVKSAYAKLKQRDITNVIAIGDPDWNTGVSGLVAGKIAEKYALPTFVWSREGDVIKGSCRGNGDISVVALMEHAPEGTFLQFGGHEGAGGFSLTTDAVHHLQENLHQAYTQLTSQASYIEEESPRYVIDDTLTLSDVTMKTYRLIEQLGPYGIGNPRPVFAFPESTIVDIRMFGKARDHLEITLTDTSGARIKAIAFYSDAKSFSQPCATNDQITLIAEFDHSTFRGKSELRLKIIDVV